MATEIRLERLDVALETTRGTAVTPPTHHLFMEGTMDIVERWYSNETNVGLLAGLNDEQLVGSEVSVSAEGSMDTTTLPVLFNMYLAPVDTPSTPGGATNARLWTFPRSMSSDNLKTGTWYWGDPNAKYYQSAYGMIKSITLSSDASGTDAAMQSFEGIGKVLTPLGAVPTLPSNTLGNTLLGARKQLWIDAIGGTIGTTEITGRVVSAEAVLPSGVGNPKYTAVGPSAAITYTRVGREAAIPELTVQVDKVDEAQLVTLQAGLDMKVRVRWNGPLIEGALYEYVQVDYIGKFHFDSWDDLEGNRTLSLMVRGKYNSTAASDVIAYVQNARTAL